MIAFSGCKGRAAGEPSEATLRSPEARARGRALFVEHCALCHGENADGHGRRREGLTGTPVDFTSAEWRSKATAEGVFAIIRDGKPGTSMPSWRSLGERERGDLTAYVLSVRGSGP